VVYRLRPATIPILYGYRTHSDRKAVNSYLYQQDASRMSMFDQAMLPEVEVYGVLSNARRREVLTELWTQPESLSLRELSERIAATESEQTPAPRALRESVYNSLHQTHLPKMDDLGLVVYDPNRDGARLFAGRSAQSLHGRDDTRWRDMGRILPCARSHWALCDSRIALICSCTLRSRSARPRDNLSLVFCRFYPLSAVCWAARCSRAV